MHTHPVEVTWQSKCSLSLPRCWGCVECKTIKVPPPIASPPPSPPRGNIVEFPAPGVGQWGGFCTCPDGQVYGAGDRGDDCLTGIACEGGQAGECHHFIDAQWSQKKVHCAGHPPPSPPFPPPSSPKVEDTMTEELFSEAYYHFVNVYGAGASQAPSLSDASNFLEVGGGDCDADILRGSKLVETSPQFFPPADWRISNDEALQERCFQVRRARSPPPA